MLRVFKPQSADVGRRMDAGGVFGGASTGGAAAGAVGDSPRSASASGYSDAAC